MRQWSRQNNLGETDLCSLLRFFAVLKMLLVYISD